MNNINEKKIYQKLYLIYNKKSLIKNLMILWCLYLVYLDFHKIPSIEERNNVFLMIIKYWNQISKMIIYDFAYQLESYCISHESEFFGDKLFIIDEIYINNHIYYSQTYFISNYMQVYS